MEIGLRVLLLLKASPAREALAGLLEEHGCEVAAQPSTFRAVSSLAKTSRDVVIVGLDDLLEEELEVVRVLREECPDAFIVVTFSGINRRKAQTALEMGANGYVLEPLKPEEVLAVLKHLSWRTRPREKPRPEPLKPEEVDFITSSLDEWTPPPEESQEASGPEKPGEDFQAPAHGNGFDALEQPEFDESPPPSASATTTETESSPDRVMSLRKLGASVAHEINNPLTTLSGWIQLLLKKANGNQDLRRTLVNMKEEADRIADVVRELSAISEPGLAGRGPIDVNLLADAVVDAFVSMNGNERIRVKKIFTSEAPSVTVDQELLVRAVCDILNSRYLGLGTSGSLVFTTTAGPDWVELHVYEPGSQVDLQPLREALASVNLDEGDAIGQDLVLARSQEIISSHGGTFTAECDPREGLSFQLRLPKSE